MPPRFCAGTGKYYKTTRSSLDRSANYQRKRNQARFPSSYVCPVKNNATIVPIKLLREPPVQRLCCPWVS
jgi:hypothetical protein